MGKLSNSSRTLPPQNILYNIPGSTPDTGPAHTKPSGCFMASMALKPACLYGFLQQDERSNCPQRDWKSATRERPCSCYPRLPACSQSCTLTSRLGLRQQVSSSLERTKLDRDHSVFPPLVNKGRTELRELWRINSLCSHGS